MSHYALLTVVFLKQHQSFVSNGNFPPLIHVNFMVWVLSLSINYIGVEWEPGSQSLQKLLLLWPWLHVNLCVSCCSWCAAGVSSHWHQNESKPSFPFPPSSGSALSLVCETVLSASNHFISPQSSHCLTQSIIWTQITCAFLTSPNWPQLNVFSTYCQHLEEKHKAGNRWSVSEEMKMKSPIASLSLTLFFLT